MLYRYTIDGTYILKMRKPRSSVRQCPECGSFDGTPPPRVRLSQAARAAISPCAPLLLHGLQLPILRLCAKQEESSTNRNEQLIAQRLRYPPGFAGIEFFMTRVRSRKKIKLLIADDHAIFREALRKLLESDDEIKIVGEARSGTECIQKLGELKPDILLLDLRMPDKNGLAVLEEVNFNRLRTRVIVLTAAEDNRDLVYAMRLGARGVVPKESAIIFSLNAYIECMRVRFGWTNALPPM
jgi:CheY-like chemotaxis protein